MENIIIQNVQQYLAIYSMNSIKRITNEDTLNIEDIFSTEKVVLFIVAEGLSYIIGAVFYGFKKMKYMHSVFHVFVVLGDVFHMLAVWFVIGMYL